MKAYRLNLLGGFGLYSPAGSPIPLSARKPMALLAYLALRLDQSHPREKIAALLWEDSPDALARSSLRQALALLRRCLPVLITEGDSLCIPSKSLITDVAEFQRAVADGSPAMLAQAVELYRGDLFDGTPSRSPTFEDWLQVERQHLRELALGALGRLLDQAQEAGDCEAGIRHALRLLALDPLREPAHRALMKFYARQGRHAAALKQYQTCRSVLEHELGVLPELETEAVLKEIRERRRSRAEPSAPHRFSRNPRRHSHKPAFPPRRNCGSPRSSASLWPIRVPRPGPGGDAPAGNGHGRPDRDHRADLWRRSVSPCRQYRDRGIRCPPRPWQRSGTGVRAALDLNRNLDGGANRPASGSPAVWSWWMAGRTSS